MSSGGQTHRDAQRKRQLFAAHEAACRPMLHLIVRHLLEDGAAAPIGRRQAL